MFNAAPTLRAYRVASMSIAESVRPTPAKSTTVGAGIQAIEPEASTRR